MSEEFNISDHFNSDGTVNADGPGLATLAGPDHAETKQFDNVKDFQGFVKSTADTKSEHGKMVKTLERAIVRPADDASDDDKAAHRTALNKARGAPESGSEYELLRPEGVPYDEKREIEFRDLLCKGGVPKDTAKLVWDWYHGHIVADHTAGKEAEAIAVTAKQDKLRVDWPGEAMIEKPRLAYKAIQALGPELLKDVWEDFKGPDGNMIKGMKTMMAEEKINDSPGDLAKWHKIGITTDNLRFYEILGRKMEGGILPGGEGGGGEAQTSEEAFADACSSQSGMAKKT